MRVFQDQTEPTEQDVEDARKDIEVAEHFINTMVSGLRSYAFFDKDIAREIKVATLARMISDYADAGGAILIGAVALTMMAEMSAGSSEAGV